MILDVNNWWRQILYLIMIVQNYVENVSFEPIKFDLSLS